MWEKQDTNPSHFAGSLDSSFSSLGRQARRQPRRHRELSPTTVSTLSMGQATEAAHSNLLAKASPRNPATSPSFSSFSPAGSAGAKWPPVGPGPGLGAPLICYASLLSVYSPALRKTAPQRKSSCITYFIHSREVTRVSRPAKAMPQATATGPIHSRGQGGHGERVGQARGQGG
jgi:hypothetical protein